MSGKCGSDGHLVKSRLGTAPLMWRCHMEEVLDIIMWQSCSKKPLRYVTKTVDSSSFAHGELETGQRCLMCTLGLILIEQYCNPLVYFLQPFCTTLLHIKPFWLHRVVSSHFTTTNYCLF